MRRAAPLRGPVPPRLPVPLRLPFAFLHRYTAFLLRRPVSRSNSHYLAKRLEGLRSLGPLIAPAGAAGAVDEPAAALLRRLSVPNFPRLAPQLLAATTPLVRDELPPDVVVTARQPRAEALAGCRRILLVLGPGIGVGDEILCFSLPRWLRRAAPGAEVHTLSAYPGLWDRVADVAVARSYERYADVVEALRNEGGEPADLVVLVDFEDPALHPLVFPEPRLRLYLEISIAGRSAALVDCERRWLHRLLVPGPYDLNYYQALSAIAEWLGARPRPGDRTGLLARRGAPPPAGELRILVSPFTSKHEPSEAFWSRLLAAAVPPGAGATRLLFDPGPNAFTERFAHALARSTAARSPRPLHCEVIGARQPGPVSLDGIFTAMEGAHAAICVDSFAAHAAPLFGCATLVLGWRGLEHWRLPGGPSFYFDATAPAEGVAAAMRHVLAAVDPARDGRGPRLTRAQRALVEAGEGLGALLAHGTGDAHALAAASRRFSDAYLAGLDETGIDAPGFAELFRDQAYGELRLPRLAADGPPSPAEHEEVARHLRHQVRRWRGSNLAKYLALVDEAAACADEATNEATDDAAAAVGPELAAR